jgi:hypothetical protein
VARVAVLLHARSIRRAGCMTRGPRPPCWACWESEKRAHLARLHAACMVARPFRTHRARRFGFFRSEPACMTCGTQPPRRRGGRWSVLGETQATTAGDVSRESHL